MLYVVFSLYHTYKTALNPQLKMKVIYILTTVAPPSVGGDSSEKEEQGAEILLNIIRPDYERPAPPPPMEPLYKLKDDGKLQGMSQ